MQPEKVHYALFGWISSPSSPRLGRPGSGVRRASGTHRGIALVSPHVTGLACTHVAGRRNQMRKLLSLLSVAPLCLAIAPASYAEPYQLLQGMQVHLTLLSTISSDTSRDGDPFVAVVAEPVYLANQLLVPAGTRVNGIIGTVAKARHFSIFRGQAYMNLTVRSIEIDSRLIPVQMSIIAIEQPHGQADAKRR